MSSLNKQRVVFDAVLTCIHTAGHDPNEPNAAAQAHIAAGVPPVAAYSRALNAYVGTLPPETQKTIGKIARLVSSSDDTTIAKYDAAINSYNESGGDEAAIEALYPMMAQDGLALALKDGEITQADIANGSGLTEALGYAPMPEQTAAIQSFAAETAPAPQVFSRDNSPAAPQAAPGVTKDEKGNVSYSSSRIASQKAPAPLSGITRDQSGGVGYSSSRSDAKAGVPRPGAFQPIARQETAPGERAVERSGASW